jgi:hypothetical protein
MTDIQWRPAEPIIVFADETKHPYAVQLLRDSVPEHPVQVNSLTQPDPDSTVPIIVLAEADDLDSSLRQALGLNDVPALDPEAYVARAGDVGGRGVIALIGSDTTGVIYAVREFVEQRVNAGPAGVTVSSFSTHRVPALPYRLFWTWDHSTNWYLEQIGLQDVGASNVYLKPANGYVEDYRRLIDFMSQNRLNGLVIYGFLRDGHGGVDAAKEIARYGKQRGVRILPGVGINSYGGVYWEGNHRYNLGTWLREHPELRAHLDKELDFPFNHFGEMACPSKEANRAYHLEAIQWLCEEFDIGGINFESGDYAVCQCPECKSRRTEEGRWSLADAAELYPPLFDAVRRSKPGAWMIAEAYFDNILDLEAVSALAELPSDTICQYCINRAYWPRVQAELTAEHVSRLPLRTNVLRTHMGSQWNGQRHGLVARTFADFSRLMTDTGMQGVDVFGEAAAFHTVNEINYLAYATFAYDREISWDEFVADVLGPRFGGAEATAEYLRLLDTPAEAPAISRALSEAREIATPLTDAEQYRRWTWLTNRLYQAQAML